jgi:hypothetical protein
MNLSLIKGGVQLLASVGAGLIADEALKKIVPPAVKGLKGVAVKVGGTVLSMMVANKAGEYVVEVWDQTTKDIKEFITPPEKITEESEEAK